MTEEVEPSLVPLNAIFADDFVELLIPVMSNMTMTEVAGAVAAHVEGIRVESRGVPKVVYYRGLEVPSGQTITEAGIPPLAHIRVDWKD